MQKGRAARLLRCLQWFFDGLQPFLVGWEVVGVQIGKVKIVMCWSCHLRAFLEHDGQPRCSAEARNWGGQILLAFLCRLSRPIPLLGDTYHAAPYAVDAPEPHKKTPGRARETDI